MITPQKSMSKMLRLMRSRFGILVDKEKKEDEVIILEVIATVETMFPNTPMKLKTAVTTPLIVDNQVGKGWQHTC